MGVTVNTPSLGIGQTWQNVSASRAIGTTYYNTTAKPIFVFCGWSANGSNVTTTLTVNGVIASTTYMDTYARPLCCGVIPPGASYVINSGVTTGFTWSELR